MFISRTRKLGLFLIVLAMSFSLAGGLEGMAGGATTSSDLADFVTGATMYDITDPSNPVQIGPNDPTFIGKTYKFVVTFEEKVDLQLAYTNTPARNGVLIYQLPPALTIQNAIDVTPIRIGNGAIVGWYTIDTDGMVLMWFDNVDSNGNPSNQNFIDYADVHITFEVFAQLAEGGGDIDFGGDINIEISPPTHPPSSLDIHKYSRYVPATDRIYYMITISALGIPGSTPVENIQLNDTPTVVVPPATGDQSIAEESLPTNAFSAFSYTVNKVGAPPGYLQPMPVNWAVEVIAGRRYYPASYSYDFAGLSLSPGDFITIRYFIDIKQLIANNPALGINPLDYAFTIDNKVTATADDVPPVIDTTTDPVKKVFPILKDGKLVPAPPATPTGIEWTVTVGDGVDTLLNEGTITDDLGPGPGMFLPPAAQIQIHFYDDSGNDLAPPGSNGSTLSTYFNWVSNVKFTFDVPPVADFGEIYQVVIVFETPIPSALFPPPPGHPPAMYVNKVTFEDVTGEEVDDTGTVTVWPQGDTTAIQKTTSGICGRPESGTGYYVTYAITVDIPGGLFANPLYLFDTLGVMPSGSGITITDATMPPADFAVTATDAGGSVLTDLQYVVQQYYQTNAWGMFFGVETNASPLNTRWQYNDPVTLTIEYTIYLPNDGLAYLQGSSGRFLQNAVYLINDRDVPHIVPGQDNFNVVAATNVNDYWPIFKTSAPEAGDPTLYNYKVTIKGDYTHPDGIDDTLFKPGSNPNFSDTFDSRLEYVPNSFYIVDGNTNITYAPASMALVTDTTLGTTSFSVDLRDLLEGGAAPSDPDWFAYRHTYEVHYQLRISNDALDYAEQNQTPLTFTNTASIEVNPAECKFNGSNTVTYHPPPPVPPLSKTMTPTGPGSSLVDVEIIINPDGSVMFAPPGQTVGPAQITAKDVLTNLMLYTDTIVIETQEKVGGVWDGVWQNQPYTFNDGALWSVNIISSNEVDFILPNETPVRITYQALVTLPVGDPGNIGNRISIFGESSEDGQDGYIVQDSGAGAGASTLDLRVFKRDAANNSILSGAEFDLYVSVLPDYTSYAAIAPTGALFVPGTDGLDRDFYRMIDGNTTGFLSHIAIATGYPLLFLLVETDAPPGYVLPQGSDAYTFFTINPAIPSATISAHETILGHPINRISDFITISNARQRGSLTIRKVFQGLAANERPSNFFIRITGPNNFDVTLDLAQAVAGYTFVAPALGAYTIAEVNSYVPGFNHTQITVNGRPATIPYHFSVTAADADIAITVTNVYRTKPPPPQTGDDSRVAPNIALLLVSAGLMGSAMLFRRLRAPKAPPGRKR